MKFTVFIIIIIIIIIIIDVLQNDSLNWLKKWNWNLIREVLLLRKAVYNLNLCCILNFKYSHNGVLEKIKEGIKLFKGNTSRSLCRIKITALNNFQWKFHDKGDNLAVHVSFGTAKGSYWNQRIAFNQQCHKTFNNDIYNSLYSSFQSVFFSLSTHWKIAHLPSLFALFFRLPAQLSAQALLPLHCTHSTVKTLCIRHSNS
jgi:hypothetical protein